MPLTTPDGRGYLDVTSERQHQAWLYWLESEMNVPSRTDVYLMQLTMEVRRFMYSFSKGSKKLGLKDFILKFDLDTKPSGSSAAIKAPMTVEQATAIAKAAWGVRLGISSPASEVSRGASNETALYPSAAQSTLPVSPPLAAAQQARRERRREREGR